MPLNAPPNTLDLQIMVRTWPTVDTPTPPTTSTSGTTSDRTTTTATLDSPPALVTSLKSSGLPVCKSVADGLPAALAPLALIILTTWLVNTILTETSMVNMPPTFLSPSATQLSLSLVCPPYKIRLICSAQEAS